MNDGGLVVWFCPACNILSLLRQAMRGECADCQDPTREDCPARALARRLAAMRRREGLGERMPPRGPVGRPQGRPPGRSSGRSSG
jgi:hypothetical protein